MRVYVNIENSKWNSYKIDFEKIANTAVSHVYKDSEISITLVGDKQIQTINKRYRGIDKPTNVLSFELGDDILLGDIFISIDTVMREAESAGIPVEEHVAHMIVHGVLHLQGYDHIKDSDAQIMETKEIKILKKLGYKNPYADEQFICNDKSCCPGKLITKLQSIKIRENSFMWYLLTALFGIVTSFGFAPFHLWPASLFGIGAMYWLVTKQKNKVGFIKAWLLSFAFGAFYGVSMFWWVLNSIYVVPELTAQFAIWTIPALMGIGLVCGCILSLPFVVIRYIQRIPAYRAVLFASIWTVVLWTREWFMTGFPWNPISNIMMNFPMVINSISLWGSFGLSFIIIGLIASFVELCRYRKAKSCWFVFCMYLVLFFIGCVYGYHNMKLSDKEDIDNYPVIRIVQPAESAAYKMYDETQDTQKIAIQKIRDLFILATADKTVSPDIIVFPETTYPYTIRDMSFPLSHILNTNVVMGVTYYNDGNFYNSMILADDAGIIKHLYSKSHLVPFGEYGPFGGLIPSPGMLSPGKGREVFTVNTSHGDFLIAPAVCYEIIFSDSLIPKGDMPNAIINITNDTWFGFTPGVYQHLDMVRRYAIESGVPVVRANYSGISAFVMSDGNIESAMSIGQSGSLDGYVWGAHNTPYRAIGRDLWLAIILAFSIIVLISISVFEKKD